MKTSFISLIFGSFLTISHDFKKINKKSLFYRFLLKIPESAFLGRFSPDSAFHADFPNVSRHSWLTLFCIMKYRKYISFSPNSTHLYFLPLCALVTVQIFSLSSSAERSHAFFPPLPSSSSPSSVAFPCMHAAGMRLKYLFNCRDGRNEGVRRISPHSFLPFCN